MNLTKLVSSFGALYIVPIRDQRLLCNKKVTFSLYLPKHQGMNTFWRVEQ